MVRFVLLMSLYFMMLSVVRCASIDTTTEIAYLPPTEGPPEVSSYEYTPTDTGYTYTYFLSNSVSREETLEIKNKGTPEEETIVTGQYVFKGDDGYRYFIKYTIDKSGNHIVIDRAAIHRIPPNLLKSLVG